MGEKKIDLIEEKCIKQLAEFFFGKNESERNT